MKKIRLYLDYQCFPVWVYENDNLLYNDLPPEISDDQWLDNTLVALQNQYDHLFIDTNTKFSYTGFPSATEKNRYLNKFKEVEYYLKETIGTSYIIENQINV